MDGKINVNITLLGHLMWYSNNKQKQHNLNVKKNINLKKILKELNVPTEQIHYILKNGHKSDINTILSDRDEIIIAPIICGG